MRLIKMFGLAAIAAVAAMPFIGAGSASATGSTALCFVHEDPCAAGNRVKKILMLDILGVLTTSILTVLCLHTHGEGEVENLNELGAPLNITVLTLNWLKCGSNAAHDNCTVTNEKLPLFDVLRTALNLGTATALNAEVHVNCSGLNCFYGSTVTGFEVQGALHEGAAGNGRLIASVLEVPKIKGILCPAISKWTAEFRLVGAAKLSEAHKVAPVFVST